MNNGSRRSSFAAGLLLVSLGVAWLVFQLVPGLSERFNLEFTWPWLVIGAGALLFILALLLNVPGMAVPAAIVGGIGGLLYYQNATGDWESWAYAWALIPGFVGIGVILAGLLEGNLRQGLRDGVGLLIISAILFAIFGSFLGGPELMGRYWPVLLILLGFWILLQALFRTRRG